MYFGIVGKQQLEIAITINAAMISSDFMNIITFICKERKVMKKKKKKIIGLKPLIAYKLCIRL